MRQIVNFNAKWAFTKQCGAIPVVFPGDWDTVDLPHTWNAVDGQDGGNDYYRGTCHYAKRFAKRELPPAEHYYLELRGANSSADVYLNGRHLSHHDGGYSTWRVDMAGAMKEDNLLVVAVDNAPNGCVYPQMADFTFYGGLYRDVNVICVPESHFDLDFYGSPGLRVSPQMDGGDAHVKIEAYLSNAKPGQRLRYTVSSRGGSERFTVESAESTAVIDIPQVRLWHGRRDPYLYTAEVELLEDGQVIDCISARFGCRSFSIDPERGFILNGQEYPLRGVSRHQDRPGIGNALLPEHHREDVELICEMGCTTVRLAHYQHDQYFYDLCDERGLVVWAEIPYISKHMPAGRENTVSQMKELLAQNYNHPSIVVWGLSNEITIVGSGEELLENHRILNRLCHDWDKTRLTTLAAVSSCRMDDPYLLIPDVVSYNHYFGWYGGDTSMNGPWFDKFHAAHPNIPIGCSEYGCEALNWHSSEPVQGDYTEEYQAYYHEELIRQLFSRKYLWATHVWNMFDFGADAREEGGENGQNHKGLISFDRRYKKDSFYAYKAWLNPEPMLHICGKRYVNRVEDVTQVSIYSNLPEVELFANGVSLGKKTAEDHFFYFRVPNRGETELLALAGELRDSSLIRKAESFDESYRLKEKSALLNWFDVEAPEGCFSLRDKIGDIMGSVRGKRLLTEAAKKLMEEQSGAEKKAAGFEIGPEMLDMLSGFTLLRFVTMAGAMLDIGLGKEELLELNAGLNRIKKSEE